MRVASFRVLATRVQGLMWFCAGFSGQGFGVEEGFGGFGLSLEGKSKATL